MIKLTATFTTLILTILLAGGVFAQTSSASKDSGTKSSNSKSFSSRMREQNNLNKTEAENRRDLAAAERVRQAKRAAAQPGKQAPRTTKPTTTAKGGSGSADNRPAAASRPTNGPVEMKAHKKTVNGKQVTVVDVDSLK